MRKLYTKPIPLPSPSDPRAPSEITIAGQVVVIRYDPRTCEFSARAKVGKWTYLYSANSREHLINELSGDIFRGGPRPRGYGRKAA
jgi:hypothetical protein